MARALSTDFSVEENTTWDQRSRLAIAHGALTNSKRPECFIKGVYPTHVTYGKGCYLYAQGKRYTDFICGLGTNLVGYGHPRINQAIEKQLSLGGITMSLGSELEVTTAERFKMLFPWCDRVRFLKTGTEAAMSAVKIARAATGRTLLLSEGYHGHWEGFISLTPPALGCVQSDRLDVRLLATNREMIKEAAAVIVEPVMTDMSDERKQWLIALREECTKHGTLLIFDEIITGFRTPKFSFSNYWGIEPDILLLGKCIAGGLPLSVILGRKEVMECGEYFVSSTFAGDTLSLAACVATIDLLEKELSLEDLWHSGTRFTNLMNDAFSGVTLSPNSENMPLMLGFPARGVFSAGPLSTEARNLLWQESARSGILFGPSWFISFAHTREILDSVINAAGSIALRIKSGNVKLEGAAPVSPFAQRMRS